MSETGRIIRERMDGLVVDAKDGGLAGRGRKTVTRIGHHAGYAWRRDIVEGVDGLFCV